MTTIAYKDGVIAYDGRITRGTQITYDDYDKCIERDGVSFVCSGAVADFEGLVGAYFGNDAPGCAATAFAVADGLVWHVAVDGSTGFWKAPLVMDQPYAIGSGSDHALTAMDMGATAYQAVELASRRDTSTGGTIRTLVIKDSQ